ncbi:MAG: phage tail protein, partial [Rhodanobacter sp.]
PPAVSTIVSALCLRAGLTAGQIDVTGLASITRTVRCLPISQIAPTRQALELLMSAYFFEMTLSDKLYFRPRGGASVASIPYLDLGASVGDEPSEPLALREANDLEIPAQIALSYINVSDDYQTGTEQSDRLISATAGTVSAVQIAIGLTPDEAKAVADTMLLDQYASRWSAPIALLGDYSRLEPTDAVTVTGVDGSTFRLRLVKKTDS